ncbi:MAG: riboflavin synthase [Holophagales bacterium]|nr:riboflavin synthase [Holophagales bacterium]
MFTGIVRERGRLIADPEASEKGGVRLEIGHSEALGGLLEIGASLAVSGVCLTVVELSAAVSVVELSPETLERTGLGELRRSSDVNLEPALRAGDAMGGHWVQGHVDGLLAVLDRRDLAEHRELAFELPTAHAPHVVEKGSVTLDGVSLTVSRLVERDGEASAFEVALIPHTLEVTTLGDLQAGDRVHFEVDILAKYVERAIAAHGMRFSR